MPATSELPFVPPNSSTRSSSPSFFASSSSSSSFFSCAPGLLRAGLTDGLHGWSEIGLSGLARADAASVLTTTGSSATTTAATSTDDVARLVSRNGPVNGLGVEPDAEKLGPLTGGFRCRLSGSASFGTGQQLASQLGTRRMENWGYRHGMKDDLAFNSISQELLAGLGSTSGLQGPQSARLSASTDTSFRQRGLLKSRNIQLGSSDFRNPDDVMSIESSLKAASSVTNPSR
ncbi:unnamed protein product [Protopolystoma xenopodis]|uniref:Uncharacterized protein n=1 Tax=Protopolystoma xenopodis TaxID=117903 RepID=A0A3S5B7T2_9PLAT|nr:unnamed protein product [Protopolystoma xenopodis]